MSNKIKLLRRLVWTLLVGFVFLNIIAAFHAYKFTHFVDGGIEKTQDPKKLSAGKKLSALVFGVNNPKPINNETPKGVFQTINLNSNKRIECWSTKTESPKGTVVLFHGFGGHKSGMLDKAYVFNELGYNTLLVDFMGSGDSEGNQTSIGFFEAEEVKTCVDYLTKEGETNIYLFGTSMGAVAIMKAIDDYELNPKGIIIECPFGSMYETVCARFRMMNVPTFPMAGLLVFWGGVENGFWGFGHNPTEYAKQIDCPTLLMYGEQDEKVSRTEINEIFANLKGQKALKVYQDAGHENYLTKYKDQWTEDIEDFLVSGYH